MQNIWSENKKINTCIIILLFVMATNFMRYGILCLPIICLLLFIDSKYKFNVNNIKTFIVLCLFGISFFAFSYKQGIYSTVGMFLPMAYYIGSNVKDINEDKIKKIIYILALGMGCHVILNLLCDLFVRGVSCFTRNSHLDFWTWDEYPATQTAILYLFMIGIFYYVFIYEDNKKIKYVILSIFLIMGIYEIALGRRAIVLLFGIIIFVSLIIDVYILKNKDKKIKTLLYLVFALIAFVVLIVVIYAFNLFNLREKLLNILIIRKFLWFGLSSGRTNIFKQALQLAPSHLFGGMEISSILGWEIHDLWMDVFDYAGIVPYVILSIHSFTSLPVFYKFYKNKNIDCKSRFLVFDLYFVSLFMLFIEPVLTGSSIFFLSLLITFAMIEKLNFLRK